MGSACHSRLMEDMSDSHYEDLVPNHYYWVGKFGIEWSSKPLDGTHGKAVTIGLPLRSNCILRIRFELHSS